MWKRKPEFLKNRLDGGHPKPPRLAMKRHDYHSSPALQTNALLQEQFAAKRKARRLKGWGFLVMLVGIFGVGITPAFATGIFVGLGMFVAGRLLE